MSASTAHSIDNGLSAIDAARAQPPWATPSLPRQGSSGPVLHFVADNEIYADGDPANACYKMISGVVRTCKFLSDGRRQIDAFHLVGDVFGFEAGSTHRLSAEAVSDCTVVPLRRRGLETLTARDDQMAGQMFSYAMRCLERAQDHSLLLGRRSASQKLAGFLLEMAQRRLGNEPTIELAMTRQDIADYLGLTIETVSRTLSQLERDGLIALPSARRICLRDPAALRELTF